MIPPSARVGDVTCILYGYGVLLVFRGVDPGYHRLVGGCYIVGLMHGEAFTIGEKVDEVYLGTTISSSTEQSSPHISTQRLARGYVRREKGPPASCKGSPPTQVQ